MNRWEAHWVYWFGPVTGGVLAGLVYEFILSPRRHGRRSQGMDGESSSINSDDDPYDDLDKSQLRGVPAGGPGARLPLASLGSPLSGPTSSSTYCAANGGGSSLYGAPPCKLDRVESLYGGTKSLYAKSPPLTRANLSRSQSVYAKAPGNGPLVAAQSLYPAMRLGPSGFGSAIGGGLGLSPMPIMGKFPHRKKERKKKLALFLKSRFCKHEILFVTSTHHFLKIIFLKQNMRLRFESKCRKFG